MSRRKKVTTADLLWEVVQDELFSRSGLDGAWDSIDGDIKEEIAESITARFNDVIDDLLVNHG